MWSRHNELQYPDNSEQMVVDKHYAHIVINAVVEVQVVVDGWCTTTKSIVQTVDQSNMSKLVREHAEEG